MSVEQILVEQFSYTNCVIRTCFTATIKAYKWVKTCS